MVINKCKMMSKCIDCEDNIRTTTISCSRTLVATSLPVICVKAPQATRLGHPLPVVKTLLDPSWKSARTATCVVRQSVPVLRSPPSAQYWWVYDKYSFVTFFPRDATQSLVVKMRPLCKLINRHVQNTSIEQQRFCIKSRQTAEMLFVCRRESLIEKTYSCMFIYFLATVFSSHNVFPKYSFK